jgi:CAAD domains of cyanobacterial aminoacyl-tRNA synthetase
LLSLQFKEKCSRKTMETPITSEEDTTLPSGEEAMIEASNSESSSPETITEQTTTNSTMEELVQIGLQISHFLEQLPSYIKRFYKAYKSPIIGIGLILAAIVTLRLMIAVIDALNDLPLFAASFEVIGIGFVIWFAYRYLLKALTRQEIALKIQILKEQIIGKSDSDIDPLPEEIN